MDNYAIILSKLNRDQEAAEWAARAQAIRDRRGE